MEPTIAPLDLIYPLGELQPVMFPNEDLVALVDVWFAQGKTRADTLTDPTQAVYDRVVALVVYTQAYQAVCDRVSLYPKAESYFNDVSREWAATTTAYFQERLRRYQHQLSGLLDNNVKSTSGQSGTVQVTAAW